MTGKTILLAEDERSLRRAAEVALTRRGFRVIPAVNGEEALHLARLHKPDLILLDLLMPKMTGMQVLDALRADPDTRELRVLILSNSSRELEITGAEALGVIDYWIKANVSLQELGDRVVKLFEATEGHGGHGKHGRHGGHGGHGKHGEHGKEGKEGKKERPGIADGTLMS